MSLINKFFGKNADDLTYSDIESYFADAQDESDKLEFKSYAQHGINNHAEKENGILRTVCGMANSGGGLIVWGAPVGQSIAGQKEKIFQGALSPIPQKVEKDRFISRVTSTITPAPSGVRHYEYESGGSYVYLIEVEPSSYSPHQFRSKYLMRADGQTLDAPHHYVEALFRKITYPKLECYVKFKTIDDMADGTIALHFGIIVLNLTKMHNEHDVYLRIVTTGLFGNEEMIQGQSIGMGRHELTIPVFKSVLYYNEPITKYVTVRINKQKLAEANNIAQFHIMFGGKSSPLKQSHYDLDLSNFTGDLNSKIVAKQLNLYSHEIGVDISEEERLATILNNM